MYKRHEVWPRLGDLAKVIVVELLGELLTQFWSETLNSSSENWGPTCWARPPTPSTWILTYDSSLRLIHIQSTAWRPRSPSEHTIPGLTSVRLYRERQKSWVCVWGSEWVLCTPLSEGQSLGTSPKPYLARFRPQRSWSWPDTARRRRTS